MEIEMPPSIINLELSGRNIIAIPILGGLLMAASLPANAQDNDLEKLKLPEGFEISVYAEGVTTARDMAISPGGIVYVGTRARTIRGEPTGKVFAIVDDDGDHLDGEVITIAEGLNMPNGIAFHDGDLYVGEIDRILRYADMDDNLRTPPPPQTWYDDLPSDSHHGWKFLRFSEQGDLFVPVGAPCNICDRGEDGYAQIRKVSEGGAAEIYAYGVRNTVGFDWHPVTGEFWFTDNGRDLLGDEAPEDELNHAPGAGMHFGYPFCHQGDLLDPELGENANCDDYTAPAGKLGPHVAAIGMTFYTGDMFPERYRNQALIALHGSWNRTPDAGHTGAKIVVAHIDGGQVTEIETLIEGWLGEDNTYWGRPVAIEQMPDGSVLISDDHSDRIYRLSYQAP
jgi:glucose/arabinose dehydrogenase